MRKKRHTTRNISSLRHLLFNPLLGSHFCLCFLGFVLQMHEQVNPFAEQPLSSWSFSFFISFDLWSFRSLSITSCFTAIRTCGSSVNKYQKYTHHRGKGHCTASPPIQLNWIGFDQTRFCYFYVLKLLIRNQSETSCAVILIPVFSLSTFDARQFF